jgi:hypothetical protein
MKRAAILASTKNPSIEPELPAWKTENDEELLKILFGLKP